MTSLSDSTAMNYVTVKLLPVSAEALVVFKISQNSTDLITCDGCTMHAGWICAMIIPRDQSTLSLTFSSLNVTERSETAVQHCTTSISELHLDQNNMLELDGIKLNALTPAAATSLAFHVMCSLFQMRLI